MNEFEEIKQKLRHFAKERDWEQFHSPKNIAMALSVEASELLEIFQWLTEDQSRNLNYEQMSEVIDELADVQLYLIRLTDLLGVDMSAAIKQKMLKNAKKYPVELVKGSSKKYHKY